MNKSITKDNLFPPKRQKAETKADITDQAARAIIQEEADKRNAKTERLREARLAMEAEQAKDPPVKKKRAKQPAG
ncbi:hypothetical protein HDIA_3793 [Hartmannibacter diazotrophicus]|uniref:Transcriptional regulator n=1 Tax=Hartmannibacter diazotrophicus TaxID=1482074 RepID=A0A2C9DAH1_9HYPH|nr:hypothetical protein [Hartmannibacter diazotrophicus]SON57334.1 hypothetical protein HDIA_3793 [Hartmannibacter diazotrophicus]